jgi:replicative DNA helicase
MTSVLEAEEGVVACCLLDSGKIDTVARSLEPDAFLDIRVKAVWAAILQLRDDGLGVDTVTVVGRLRLAGELNKIGGIGYVSSLEDRVPSASNLPYYIEQVKDAYAARSGLEALKEAYQELDHGAPADKVFSTLETVSLELREKHSKGASKPTVKDLVLDVIMDMENAADGISDAMPSGIGDLDNCLGGGFYPGELSVLGARPSMGKSALSKDIAVSMAVERESPVGVFSLEDQAKTFCLRALSGLAKVPARQIRRGKVMKEYALRLPKASGKLGKSPLYLDDESPASASQIVAKMSEWNRNHGCRMFIVDYLQYVTPDINTDARDQQVAQISKTFKSAAKRLDVHIMALAQLNRDADRLEPGVHPVERHLGESSAIEKDADVIMMLHKDKEFQEDGAYGMINLHVLKQRNGPRYVNIPLTLFRDTVHFEAR